MSKILLIVTTVLVLACAALSFLTKGKVDGLNSEKENLSDQLGQKQSQLVKLEGDLKTSQEQLATATSQTEKAQADLASATRELSDTKNLLADANTQIEEKNKEIQDLNARTGRVSDDGSGHVITEAPDVAEIQQKLKDSETQLAEARQLNDSLTGKISEMDSQMATLKEEAERRDRQMMAKGLEGQILAVNRAWNFVVLSIGDRQGVVQNAEMVVVRDGQAIARVKITSVEPTTSIADVVPGTLAKGAQVRPGDSVIYPGA